VDAAYLVDRLAERKQLSRAGIGEFGL